MRRVLNRFNFCRDIDVKNASLLNILRAECSKAPMSFPQFWNKALLHEKFGYYMKQDVFNKQGDFVTSVEISQMFNEILAVWCIHSFQVMGLLDADNKLKDKLRIVEFGPGLGTLSANVLRVLHQFDVLDIKYSYIEMSEFLRSKQQQKVQDQLQQLNIYPRFDHEKEQFTSDGITLSWHKTFEEFQKTCDGPTIVLAHEFFDALPVHIFEYQNEWFEKVVVCPDGKTLTFDLQRTEAVHKILAPEKYFKSPQVRASIKNGDTIEISPQSQVIAHQIAQLLSLRGGAALIVDYGDKRAYGDSVRAIARHKLLDKSAILGKPGDCDLSAYVNFMALENAALQVPNIKVDQIMTQGKFLEQMGIHTRLQILCQNSNSATEKRLQSEYERLVSSTQMGEQFKFMLIRNAKYQPMFPFIEDSQQIYY